MEQSLTFYDKVYPLYLGDGMKEKIMKSFPVLEELEGFIAFGTCEFNFMGKHYGNYIAFANPIYRDVGGMKLANHGLDMSRVAIAEPIELKNPMPIFKEYKETKEFKDHINQSLKFYNDKVILTADELIKIISVCQEALNKNQLAIDELFNLDELPLPNMSLVLGGSRIYNFATNRQEKTITFEHYLLKKLLYRVELQPTLLYETNEVNTKIKVKFVSPVITYKDLEYTEFQNIFLAVNYFIKHIPASYHETKKKVEETIAVGKGNNKKYKRVIHLEREYNFNDLDKISKTHLKHIFTCLCWGVRGHIRHYKSGKTTFIQPYKKGKERNNLNAFSGKEYRL